MTEQPNFDKVEVLRKGAEDERTIYTLNGEYHRTDGPAVEWADGNKWWYQNGKLHRTDGPAIVLPNGSKWWYQNGELHRADGPAFEGADGSKFWCIEGVELTEKEFNERTRND